MGFWHELLNVPQAPLDLHRDRPMAEQRSLSCELSDRRPVLGTGRHVSDNWRNHAVNRSQRDALSNSKCSYTIHPTTPNHSKFSLNQK